jgi:CBS domain-containing protein
MNTKWKKVAIAQNDTILSALKLINDEPLKVVLVVDDNDGLLGVVTDGDIRRGLLNNLQLSDPVSLVMNAKPIIASLNASSDELRSLMESGGVLMIPIIDDGKVVGLETLHHLLAKPKYATPYLLWQEALVHALNP